MNDAVADLLDFWFSDEARPRWFDPDPAFDATCRERFRPLVEAAELGALDEWAATPEGALGLCLLLDQLPRNLYRKSPRAFATDAAARAVADAALKHGFDARLPPERRVFLYLPFEHSEDLADQERSVALFAALGDPEKLDHAKRHREVIARFGRFPHRNAVLDRGSTAAEEAYLSEPGAGFGGYGGGDEREVAAAGG